jgi:sensor domain CHASE-containing protein
MKLRTKSLIVICVGFSILCLILGIILNTIVIKGYSDLEINIVTENVGRVLNQFNQEYNNLEATARDWSIWNDTYFFVEDKNEEYIQSNIQYESFKDIKINFMLFYNTTDSLVFSRAFDFQRENETILPSNFYTYILQHNESLLIHRNLESSQAGIIFYDKNETPLLVAVTPILQSEREGPVHGSMIVGRFLDENKIKSIANITHLAVVLHPKSSELSVDLQHVTSYTERIPIFIQPINSTYIVGYVVIDDIFGSPVFVMEIGSQRDVYNHGIAIIQTLLIYLIITVFISIALIIIILDRFITSRLTSLTKSVNDIKNYSDLSKHLQVKGNDEIAILEKNFNDMLMSLQKTWAMKDSAEFSLHKKIDELERFKMITVEREIKMIELKKQLDELKAKSGEKT